MVTMNYRFDSPLHLVRVDQAKDPTVAAGNDRFAVQRNKMSTKEVFQISHMKPPHRHLALQLPSEMSTIPNKFIWTYDYKVTVRLQDHRNLVQECALIVYVRDDIDGNNNVEAPGGKVERRKVAANKSHVWI